MMVEQANEDSIENIYDEIEIDDLDFEADE